MWVGTFPVKLHDHDGCNSRGVILFIRPLELVSKFQTFRQKSMFNVKLLWDFDVKNIAVRYNMMHAIPEDLSHYTVLCNTVNLAYHKCWPANWRYCFFVFAPYINLFTLNNQYIHLNGHCCELKQNPVANWRLTQTFTELIFSPAHAT